MMENLIRGYILYMDNNSSVSKSTMDSYIGDLETYKNYLEKEGIRDIRDTNKTIILKYLMFLQENGRATSTIARNISSIRSFYQYLLNNNFISSDPTVNLKTPKVEKKIPNILTIEEVEILLEQPDISTFKGVRDKAMLELLYSTGIAINELVNLNIEDVNLTLELVEIKSSSNRVVPIGSIAVEAIRVYISKYSKSFTSEALFVNQNKGRISRQGFWKNLKEYEKQSGIDKNITPQILRQSFAVHMIENGADLKTVQKLLGHKDISATQMYALTSENRSVREVYKNSHPRA